jgi:hypothetical protein
VAESSVLSLELAVLLSSAGVIVTSFAATDVGAAVAEDALVEGDSSEWWEETFAPVFARLCCFWLSESDGDRDRFLFVSDSGIVAV